MAKDKFLLSDRVLERKNYVESFGVKCGKMCQLRRKHTGLCRNLQNTIWCVFVAVLGENFFMASRKSSLASENYHFTSHKSTGNKSLGQALAYSFKKC